MTRLFGTAAAIAILGAGVPGTALAQYQTYQPNPYPQGYGAYPQQTMTQPAYPQGYAQPEMAAQAPYRGDQPQYGTSSHQYPPGPGGQWQQSYQVGAQPGISGTVSVPPDAVTSQGTTMANPAYMPSAARLGTDGGVTVPAYGSAYPPPGYAYPPGYGYPVR